MTILKCINYVILLVLVICPMLSALDSDFFEQGRIKARLLNIDTDNPLLRIENNSGFTFCVKYPVGAHCKLYEDENSELFLSPPEFAAASGPWKTPMNDILVGPSMNIELQLAEPWFKNKTSNDFFNAKWSWLRASAKEKIYKMEITLSGIDKAHSKEDFKMIFNVK